MRRLVPRATQAAPGAGRCWGARQADGRKAVGGREVEAPGTWLNFPAEETHLFPWHSARVAYKKHLESPGAATVAKGVAP